MACARCSPQGLIVFLFGRTLYYELDVDAELQRGALPAAIALSHKLVPASKVVVRKTLESLKVRGVGWLAWPDTSEALGWLLRCCGLSRKVGGARLDASCAAVVNVKLEGGSGVVGQ